MKNAKETQEYFSIVIIEYCNSKWLFDFRWKVLWATCPLVIICLQLHLLMNWWRRLIGTEARVGSSFTW